MSRTLTAFIFVLLYSSANQSVADLAEAEDNFARGSAFLNDDKYEKALQSFTSLINEEQFAPELFLQIGNAHYRLQDIGSAALSYRRALLLKSSLFEARQNLTLIKNKVGFIDTELLGSHQVLTSSNESFISTLLAISLWLIGIGVILIILKIRHRKSVITLLVIGVLCASSSAILSRAKDSSRPDPRTNIVTKNNTIARTAPAQSASTIITLPPGSSVILISGRGTWSYIKLPNELHGWVRTESLEELWPYNPEFSD
ncbi:MAG: hypothetical protein VYC70_08800 [Verrucomicrobiota bacterium]|nr:hypothetical protein [Verrucomicrobiota bacterium]